jgi:hypothetical protein
VNENDFWTFYRLLELLPDDTAAAQHLAKALLLILEHDQPNEVSARSYHELVKDARRISAPLNAHPQEEADASQMTQSRVDGIVSLF